MSIVKRFSESRPVQGFKNSRFAGWFKRTFKKQEDLTAGEMTSLLLFLVLLVILAPAIAAQNRKKKK